MKEMKKLFQLRLERKTEDDEPNLQPTSANGHSPKKPQSVVGIQKIINRMSAKAKLKINKLVGVCIPLLRPMPMRTKEFPIRPSTKNMVNKQIFKIPNFNS